jgi:hypothetical protein
MLAGDMLPPGFFTDKRMSAPHFIQARVLGWDGVLHVKITRVFRGDLRRGDRLDLAVSIANDAPLRLGDPTLWAYERDVAQARYVEAFLDGDPPTVVCDQIKFLKDHAWFLPRRPSGDPAAEGFIW